VRIIFLDIDGVLISRRTHSLRSNFKNKDWKHVDLNFCKWLKMICETNDIRIVISSSWRRMPTSLIPLLKKAKLLHLLHETDPYTTTNFSEIKKTFSYVRGDEIQLWLDNHLGEWVDYLILDDDSDFLEHQMKNHIKTDINNGVQFEQIRSIFKWVYGEKSPYNA